MPVCTGCVPSWPATGELESKRGCAGGHREHGQTPASKLTCLAHVLCVRAHMCTVAHRPPPAPPPLLRSELLKPAPISQVQGLLGKAELLAPGTAQAMLGEYGKVRGRGGEERKGPRPGGGCQSCPISSLPDSHHCHSELCPPEPPRWPCLWLLPSSFWSPDSPM